MSNSKYLIINKYQIDFTRLLGKGAMAKVYLGYYKPGQTDKNTVFAVKQISINSSMIATDSLLQEINLLRKFTHPYILKYIDAKKTPNSLFLFIQYCDKGTLEDFILESSEQELDEEIIRRFIAQMVIAMKFLKEREIIHRDIKPKNILIHNEYIKISDFGVAKIINDHNFDQQITTFSGTIPFMSPQILKQEKYTFQTDVWSLGITIYFMIFRKLPWKSLKVTGLIEQIQTQGVEIPEMANINPLLRDLLSKMLMTEEGDRITIQKCKEHEYLRDEVKKLEDEILKEEITYETKEITKAEFMMNSLATNNEQNIQKLLERRSLEINMVRLSHISKDSARDAYRKLSSHKENILFLKENLEYLRTCNMKKQLISIGLFKKCQFLLVKRCYIIAKDLQQIFIFSTHAQGNIIIPKAEFIELIEGKNIYYKSLRNEVDRLYEQFKNDWLKTKESFYSYQRKEGIKIRPREDAYLQNLVESSSLILAFNDNFLDLFFYFSSDIVDKFTKDFSEPIANSIIFLEIGVKVQFVYDLMIILCFPKVIEKNENLKNYRKQRKSISCQQYIYRIMIAHNQWKEKWQPVEQFKQK